MTHPHLYQLEIQCQSNHVTFWPLRKPLNLGSRQGWQCWRTRLSRTRQRLWIGKTTISMRSNDTALSHASSNFIKMRLGGHSTRYSHFERWILYTVNLTRYERHLPRIPLSALDIKDVIRLLRGVAETTDNNATYNLEDTFENNLFKITGSIKNIGRDISLARSVVVS